MNVSFQPNPFRPGAGRVPPELAGRTRLLDEFHEVVRAAIVSGEGQRPWMLTGLRGVGKTVLLNQFGRDAAELGAIVVKAEASSTHPLSSTLAKELFVALRKVMSVSDKAGRLWHRAARALRSFQLSVDPSGRYTFGIGIEPERGLADSGELSIDLQELFEAIGHAAREAGTALVLEVDEVQEAQKADREAFILALHAIGQSAFPLPIVVVGAGLPSLPATLAEATSYAERLFDYREVGLLDAAATEAALVNPLAGLGVSWTQGALSAAIEAAGGYPYLIQAIGSHVWQTRTSSIISLEDARIGIEFAQGEVEQGLYRSRWDRATASQRRFMGAMAQDHGASSVADLVTRLGKRRTTDLSVNRRDLIRAGNIYAPERGFVAFTVPGMAEFVARQEE